MINVQPSLCTIAEYLLVPKDIFLSGGNFCIFQSSTNYVEKSSLLCGVTCEDCIPLGKWFSWFSRDSGLQQKKIALIFLFLFNCRFLVWDLEKPKKKGQNIDKFPDIIAMKTINLLTEKYLQCKMMRYIYFILPAQWYSF